MYAKRFTIIAKKYGLFPLPTQGIINRDKDAELIPYFLYRVMDDNIKFKAGLPSFIQFY